METKTIPFDLETAKKIQAGEIEGRIVSDSEHDVRVVCFDKRGSFPIVALINLENGNHEFVCEYNLQGINPTRNMSLFIELPKEEPKHKFNVGDKVKVVINEKYPSTVGKVGTVVKAQTGSSDGHSISLYKVRLDGTRGALFGLADDDCLELVPDNKFKPFDKVLVRDYDNDWWVPTFFGFQTKGGLYRVVNGIWKQCIPYEGNEHLVGTTNEPE